MEINTFNIVVNLLALAFWFRVWMVGDSRLFFNPYLRRISLFTEHAMSPLLGLSRWVPTRYIALFFVLVILAVRGIAVAQLGPWWLGFGFEKQVCRAAIGDCLTFSLISFGIFLFQVWGLSLLFVRGRHGSFEHAPDFVQRLAAPFSDMKAEARPLVLAVYGIVLGLGLNIAGIAFTGSIYPWQAASFPSLLLKLFISALAAWLSLLPFAVGALFVLIIGSWIALFADKPSWAAFFQDWIDLFLGPLRKYPIRLGMLDLTPLIMIFAVQMIYPFFMNILERSYMRL